MTRLAVLLCGVAMLTAGSAEAALRLHGGDVRPRHWNWARQAAQRVPLADVQIAFVAETCGGGACYEPSALGRRGTLYLPGPRDYGYANERFLFVHELGHAYDFRHLDRRERDRFRTAIGTACAWWSERCAISPGEKFAEAYAFCGLGLRYQDLDGIYTYGWYPAVDACALIRSFA